VQTGEPCKTRVRGFPSLRPVCNFKRFRAVRRPGRSADITMEGEKLGRTVITDGKGFCGEDLPPGIYAMTVSVTLRMAVQ
jgi:hypothetical protein